MNQKTGTLATLAILAAIASYFLTFSHHHLTGLIVAIAAIPLGVGGFVMSASPRVSGGIMSIISILLAIFAIGIAVLAIVF